MELNPERAVVNQVTLELHSITGSRFGTRVCRPKNQTARRKSHLSPPPFHSNSQALQISRSICLLRKAHTTKAFLICSARAIPPSSAAQKDHLFFTNNKNNIYFLSTAIKGGGERLELPGCKSYWKRNKRNRASAK